MGPTLSRPCTETTRLSFSICFECRMETKDRVNHGLLIIVSQHNLYIVKSLISLIWNEMLLKLIIFCVPNVIMTFVIDRIIDISRPYQVTHFSRKLSVRFENLF